MNNRGNEDNRDRFIYGDTADEGTPTVLINKKEKNIEKTVAILLVAVALVLLAVIIFLINKGYVIKNTIIYGESAYSEESIRELFSRYCEEIGSNSYFYIETGALEKKITDELPYVKSVKIEKKAPDTLIFTIEGEVAQAYIEHLGSYYLLNSDMKVLEKLDSEPIRPRLIRLDIELPLEISVGSVMLFPEDGSMDAETYARIYSALESSGVRERVEFLNVRNKFDLSMILHGGVDVKIGSVKDIEEKLKTLNTWLEDNPDEIRSTLNLDISILKKIHVSYD